MKLASHDAAVGLQLKLVYPVFHDTVPLLHVTVHDVHVVGQVVDDVEYTVNPLPCCIVCHWKLQLAGACTSHHEY